MALSQALSALSGLIKPKRGPLTNPDFPAPAAAPVAVGDDPIVVPQTYRPPTPLRIDPELVSRSLTNAIASESQRRQADRIRMDGALDGKTDDDLKAEQDMIQAKILGAYPDDVLPGMMDAAFDEPIPAADYAEGDRYRALADQRRGQRSPAPKYDANRQGTLAQALAVIATGALGGRADLAQRGLNADVARRAGIQYGNDQQAYAADERARLEDASAYDRRGAQADRREDQMTAREVQARREKLERFYREQNFTREEARFKAGQDLQREQMKAVDERARQGNAVKLTLAQQKVQERRIENYNKAWDALGGVSEERMEEYAAGLEAIEKGGAPSLPAGPTVRAKDAETRRDLADSGIDYRTGTLANQTAATTARVNDIKADNARDDAKFKEQQRSNRANESLRSWSLRLQEKSVELQRIRLNAATNGGKAPLSKMPQEVKDGYSLLKGYSKKITDLRTKQAKAKMANDPDVTALYEEQIKIVAKERDMVKAGLKSAGFTPSLPDAQGNVKVEWDFSNGIPNLKVTEGMPAVPLPKGQIGPMRAGVTVTPSKNR